MNEFDEYKRLGEPEIKEKRKKRNMANSYWASESGWLNSV